MANATVVFKSLDNFSNKTTVIVEVDSVPTMPHLQDVVFHNSGKAYECKELKTALTREKLTEWSFNTTGELDIQVYDVIPEDRNALLLGGYREVTFKKSNAK